LYVASWGWIDKMAGFLERAIILEDYPRHGSGAFVFVFLYFVVKALISGSGCRFSYWVSSSVTRMRESYLRMILKLNFFSRFLQ
jgi:hypothetical protein